MGRFTESPLFLLTEYLDQATDYWTILYVKDRITNVLSKIRFRIESHYLVDDKYLKMKKRVETLSPTASGYDPEPDFENGSEIYIRKDSSFHTWLEQHSLFDEYRKFVNTDKQFVYLGKVFSTAPAPYYHIELDGLRFFSFNALPESNRTDKIKELFKIFFDRVYQKPYHLLKDIWSLIDPEEVDINFLYYIASMYKLTDLENIEDSRRREYVKNIIHFLKRKGTYSSMYVIFNTLLFNTLNYLNIYERHHLSNLPSNIPLEFFRDFLYTSYYTGSGYPSGGAGSFYYSAYSSVGYPEPEDSGDSYVYIYIYPWIVQHGLESDWPITWAFNFDRERLIPINIESINDNRTDYEWIGGSKLGSAHILEADYEHTQTAPSGTWIVNHNLNSQYVIVQCYDTNRKKIFPANVHIDNNNTCTITMGESIAGYAGITEPDTVYTQSVSSELWQIVHNSGAGVMASFFNGSGDEIVPGSFTLDNENMISVTWGVSAAARFAAIKSTGASLYLLTQTPEPSASGYLVLSPHYKVEVDLSNQPEGVDYIMNEELINTLIDNWEIDRPAVRVAHYQELISPLADFSGTENNLYDPTKFTASLNSKFCQTPALSAGIMSKTLSGGYWKIGTGGSSSWDAEANNDLESPALSGTFTNKANMDFYYIDFEHKMDEKLDVTEMGIFNEDGIVFYSYFDKIHVPVDVNFFIHYRISKTHI